MVGDREVAANRILEIVVLFVVRDVVNAVRREIPADIGGSRTFTAATEGIFEPLQNLVVTE